MEGGAQPHVGECTRGLKKNGPRTIKE